MGTNIGFPAPDPIVPSQGARPQVEPVIPQAAAQYLRPANPLLERADAIFTRFKSHIQLPRREQPANITQEVILITPDMADLSEINELIELATKDNRMLENSFSKKMKEFEVLLVSLEKQSANKQVASSKNAPISTTRANVQGFLQWTEVRKKFYALSKTVDKRLERWNESWTLPKGLMGKASLDYSLLNYRSTMAFAKDIIDFYHREKRNLTNESFKQQLLQDIRELFQSLSLTQETFHEEQLAFMQTTFTAAQAEYAAAKANLQKMPTDLRTLIDSNKRYQSSLATLREVEANLEAASSSLINLKQKLPKNLQTQTLIPVSQELADNEERLANTYHNIQAAIGKDQTTVSKLLVNCAVKQSESEQMHKQFGAHLVRLTKHNPNLIKMLGEPFVEKGWQIDKSSQTEVLELTKELAFIVAVQETLPKTAPQGLKDILQTIKEKACKTLGFEHFSSSARSLYHSVLKQEARLERAELATTWKTHQVELYKKNEEGGLSERTKLVVHGLLVVLQLGARFEQIYKQGASTLKKGEEWLAKLEQNVPENVEKAAAFIGKVLEDNSLEGLTDQQFANLTKPLAKWGTGAEVLLAKFRSDKLSMPGKQEAQRVMSAFKIASMMPKEGPHAHKDVSGWMKDFLTPQEPEVVPNIPIHPENPNANKLQLENRQVEVVPMQTSSASRTHQGIVISVAKAIMGLVRGIPSIFAQPVEVVVPAYPEGAEMIATTQLDYGKKCQKIQEMHEMVERLHLQGVEVPKFHGMASQHMEHFLQNFDPTIFSLWRQMGISMRSSKQQAKTEPHFY